MFKRVLEEEITRRLINSKKIITVYGARQVGKTTLIKKIIAQMSGSVIEVNADENPFSEILSSRNHIKLMSFVGNRDILFIDEAQRIPDIGLNLKILHDQMPELRIIITGSSTIDLADRVVEPLTGRTWTYRLYPISYEEQFDFGEFNLAVDESQLNLLLLYGMYPEILTTVNINDKRELLLELTNAAMYKDIYTMANIRYPEKLRQLLQLLAYQIGNLISIHELAKTLQVNRDTVVHYIDLLEKSFIIFKLTGYRRNLRTEVTKMNKIYFYDVGIRNAIIQNFNYSDFRPDKGQLWENFMIAERLKRNENHRFHCNKYFWRLHSGSEIDYVEEYDGRLEGYEIKWQAKKRNHSKTWLRDYNESTYSMIDRTNFRGFVMGKGG